MDENSLKDLLLKENEEFKNASKLHKRYDSEMEELQKKKFPTEVEKVRIRELKKKKLIYKDRLHHILTEYKLSHRPKD